MHITPPSGRDGGHQLEYIVILVATLEQTQITVDAGYEAVYLILTAAETEGGERLIGAAQRPVVGIDTVYLDMNTQERDTLTPVLAVELTRVHLTAHSLQAAPELRQHGEYHSLILGADDDIIHKTDIMQPTLINSPVVQIIQIVVHGVLPDQVTDGTAYTGRFLKQALAFRDILNGSKGDACADGASAGREPQRRALFSSPVSLLDGRAVPHRPQMIGIRPFAPARPLPGKYNYEKHK